MSGDGSKSQDLEFVIWAAVVTWLLAVNHAAGKLFAIEAAGDNG